MTDGNDDLSGLSGLTDPLRRRLYDYVIARGVPVGREEAATAVGVSRSLAAYHLDRLVQDDLLETRFERLSGRQGPGAGRPAKLYERSARRFRVTLPPRDFEVPARLFARAISNDDEVANRVAEDARAYGTEIGDELRRRCGESPTPTQVVRCLFELLRERGYEPYDDEGTIRLRNCPFDELAADHRDLV